VEPFYRLVEELLRLPVRHNMRWRVEGIERIPRHGAVLLASNHISYFDPVAIGNLAHLAGRRARFLAKSELFEGRFMAAGLRRMGQIPIERGRGDTGALDRATAALLEVRAGAPAFSVERITHDQRGRVIEYVVSVLRGDRYKVVLQLRHP